MKNLATLYRVCLLIMAILVVSGSLLAQKPVVRIGIVFDGPSERNQTLANSLTEEIRVVLEDEYAVEFPANLTVTGNWRKSELVSQIDRLLNDPSVDILIATGLAGSQELARRSNLPKPVFAAFVIDPELQRLPVELVEVETLRPGEVERYRTSGVANLNYLLYGGGGVDNVLRFREIVRFNKLTFLVMDAWPEVLDGLESEIRKRLATLNLERVDIVKIGRSVAGVAEQIPTDTDAVFFTPLPQLPESNFSQLVAKINARGIPSCSSEGKSEVEKGVLVAFTGQDDPTRRFRRIALNIQEALEDLDPGEMSIEFERESRPVINMATARQVGISPKYTVLLEAELLNVQAGQLARNLSLSAVVREAGMMNLDLLAADRRVSAGEESVRGARAPLLPQIGLSGGFSLIDSDRARTIATIGETELSASLEASQLIYSDRAWAGYSIEKSLQDQRQEERAQLRLDVIDEAARGYLDLLRAKTVERIQKENLELTRSNLDLASARVEIGVAGREELFRWQSQVATNQRDVISAQAFRKQARLAVNRILNRPLTEEFGTAEASLSDPDFVANFEVLGAYIDNPQGFALYSAFMTEEALAAAPELKQFDAAIQARERELLAERRSFFLPDFSLDGGVTAYRLGGAGSELPEGMNNTNWFVGISARLPLFEGGARYARVHRVQLQLEELSLQRDATGQRVEERIRALLEAANASYIGIELSRAQAEAARQNLELVTDSYAAGVVEILVLLDAQNEKLVADLVAANAVYQYLSDLMAVQRAVGRFDFFRTPEERQAYLARLEEFYRDRGVAIRKP